MRRRSITRCLCLLHALLALSCFPPLGCSPAVRSEPAAVAPRPARALPAASANAEGVALGTHGAVASAELNASKVGLATLQRGGNAVDAAIAVAFALAVTHPSAGNLGGGGFMLVRMADGRTAAIDYREAAPLAASANMYLDAKGEVTPDSVLGPRAAGIPGTVAGLGLAHQRFGSRPWAELVRDAIALARDGHALEAQHAQDMARAVDKMRAAGFADTARLFTAEDGSALAEGQLWKQPQLAATLESIASGGADAFYRGPLADAMVRGMQQLGGLWSATDLTRYRAIERKPLVFEYRGHSVISMPPPSSGGIVLRQILGASELLDIKSRPWRSSAGLHLYVEAARRAYADRNELLGDPDFVSVPTERLTAPEYIRTRMHDIDPQHATPSSAVRGGDFSDPAHQTTHFSVVDDWGNAVSNTYTLNTEFGADVAIPGTGILLNNEMDDFAAKPGSPNVYGLVQSDRNAIAPGKRMLSSMTPTIIVKGGQLRAVVGSPGGPTITNTVAQIVRALLDYERPLDEAVRAPRLHHQWKPDVLLLESSFEPELERELQALGHSTTRRGSFGHANCIEVDRSSGGFRAVADVTRKSGSALAY